MKLTTGNNPIIRPVIISGSIDHPWTFMLGLSSFALISLSSLSSCLAASGHLSAIAPHKPSQNLLQPASGNNIRTDRSPNQPVMQLAQSDRWTRQVLNQLNKAAQAAGEGGARRTHEPFIGELGRGADDTVTITLRKGTSYAILGVCDEHCSDIDLEIYDDNGKLIASDIGRNDIPLVRVTPRWNARFTIRVMMPRCTNAPCRYGIGVFGK